MDDLDDRLKKSWRKCQKMAWPHSSPFDRPIAHNKSEHKYPLALESVSAGFPSPAADFIEKRLSLDELLIEHPAATFFLRVMGRSMVDAHLDDGDILVVDRALEPQAGDIVVAQLDGEFTVKRLKITAEGIVLVAENRDYPSIQINPDQDFQVWGIVTSSIRRHRRASR